MSEDVRLQEVDEMSCRDSELGKDQPGSN
uniref:Uncharacterized protein n=1 Tax=Rhodnius prolixus TaxID=13249 RepID=T1I208_RHOPR